MLGNNFPKAGWPACGEIDIMEQLGHEPGRTHGTLHGPGYAGDQGPSAATELPNGRSLSDAFHVFAIDWAPGKIEWSLDGAVFFRRTPAQLPAGARWVFDAPAFLLLNLAIGGTWPGSPDAATTFPQTLLVDYVRVYAQGPVAVANP
jgi:beta-glucanase (GH16 family)